MTEPLRHRQTKEAETAMFSLQPPRHIPTLPAADHSVCGAMSATGQSRPSKRAAQVNRRDLVVAPDVGDLDLMSGCVDMLCGKPIPRPHRIRLVLRIQLRA